MTATRARRGIGAGEGAARAGRRRTATTATCARMTAAMMAWAASIPATHCHVIWMEMPAPSTNATAVAIVRRSIRSGAKRRCRRAKAARPATRGRDSASPWQMRRSERRATWMRTRAPWTNATGSAPVSRLDRWTAGHQFHPARAGRCVTRRLGNASCSQMHPSVRHAILTRTNVRSTNATGSAAASCSEPRREYCRGPAACT